MLNWANLVGKGRARDIGIGWDENELDALLTLERERGLARTTAAEYLRKGIMTVEDYDKDIKKGNKVKEREELEKEAKELGIEASSEIPSTILAKEIERKKTEPIIPPTVPEDTLTSDDATGTTTIDVPSTDVAKGVSETKTLDKDAIRTDLDKLGVEYDGRKTPEALAEILNKHTSKEQ